MSIPSVIVACVLVAQIAGGDRYGVPAGEADSPFSDLPETSTPAANDSKVAPPPRFSPGDEAEETTPISSEKFDYSTPVTQPNPPAARQRVNTTPKHPVTEAAKPSELMAEMLAPPAGTRLTGQSIELAAVLAGASSRAAQSAAIEAYWDLCSAVADYYLRVREQDELQRLKASSGSPGPTWQQAEAELGVRLATAQRAAVASQYRLANMMTATSAGLPLPADVPHCGDYYARYDQVFAGRETPEAKQLSELLPMRYEELCAASIAVTRAEQNLDAVSAQRGGDGSQTLRAHELLALRRRAFVEIARDYNRRIKRYTELASPGQIDTDSLIGMLIRRSDANNTATRPSTPVPPPNRQSQMPIEGFDESNAQTFAEGWEGIKSAAAEAPVDEGVKPASAESPRSKPRRERSLLVPSG